MSTGWRTGLTAVWSGWISVSKTDGSRFRYPTMEPAFPKRGCRKSARCWRARMTMKAIISGCAIFICG
ncbi:hypothetical protein D3C87_1686990 [compost metagenome]